MARLGLVSGVQASGREDVEHVKRLLQGRLHRMAARAPASGLQVLSLAHIQRATLSSEGMPTGPQPHRQCHCPAQCPQGLAATATCIQSARLLLKTRLLKDVVEVQPKPQDWMQVTLVLTWIYIETQCMLYLQPLLVAIHSGLVTAL